MEEWGKISKQNQNGLQTNAERQACRWGFKRFISEMRLREYKSTLIDKGLKKSISVKPIVSQRPCLYISKKSNKFKFQTVNDLPVLNIYSNSRESVQSSFHTKRMTVQPPQ